MLCTFYSHYTGFENILAILRENYPNAQITTRENDGSKIAEVLIKGGLFSATKKLILTYRQKANLSYQFSDQDHSPLAINLNGLYGYISSHHSTNERIKELLLHKVETVNAEFSLGQEGGHIKGVAALIEQLALSFDAFIFAQPKTPISRSETQHFLDKHLNLILDGDGRCEVDNLEVKIESHYFDPNQTEAADEQIARKAATETLLQARLITINPHLPCIEAEQETTIRTPKEIATRVCVLAVTNFVAFGVLPADEAIRYLKTHNLWTYATPKEKDFLLHPTAEKRTSETWKSECIWTLMWALGKVDDIGFADALCDLNDIPPDQYPIAADKDPNLFIAAATTSRSVKELLDANDLYYRLDWACVNARLHQKEMKQVHPGIVYERHYALNWLICYQDAEWDDVSCDT